MKKDEIHTREIKYLISLIYTIKWLIVYLTHDPRSLQHPTAMARPDILLLVLYCNDATLLVVYSVQYILSSNKDRSLLTSLYLRTVLGMLGLSEFRIKCPVLCIKLFPSF